MIQISLRDITFSHSSVPLVENGNLIIETGERVALIGRNGSGKSTLLKIIHEENELDHGLMEKARFLKTALLPQAVPVSIPGTVNKILQSQLINDEDWKKDSKVAKVLSQLQLGGEILFDSLSGGLKRLVLLASILLQEPDVLLLDEPTNHLDIEKINLLEKILSNFNKTIIFITHDRSLLQKLATHIVEIDNGKLISWRGSYEKYLQHKETLLEAETKANAQFDKKLAAEEVWIRQGIKARRTRNEGRVRLLKKMREERLQRRSRQGVVKLTQNLSEASGKIVFEVNDLCFAYGSKMIVNHFSTIIQRNDRIGLLGPNGIGKTTFINLLLGKIKPDSGEVKLGTKLAVGYFDQHRLQLNDDLSILETLSEAGETIKIGNHEKHVMSYLQDFLFKPQQAHTPIKKLSGGERNRVMLAKLFSKPCNVLVLDEPTNDLDIETLELLEERLIEFKGTVLLISHDRSFINNVVTSTIVFEENGDLQEYIGGFDDWLKQKQTVTKPEKIIKFTNKPAEKISTKLSFKEKKELDNLPHQIEKLEQRQHEIHDYLADPQFYKEKPEQVASLNQELSDISQKLTICFERWEELEKKAQS